MRINTEYAAKHKLVFIALVAGALLFVLLGWRQVFDKPSQLGEAESGKNDIPLAAQDWQEAGLNGAALQSLELFSDRLSDRNALLLIKDGKVVFERYHHSTERQLWAMRSAANSLFTGLLIAALDDEKVSLQDEVCKRSQAPITVNQIVTQTAGIDKRNMDCNAPRWFPPGDDFAYSDAGVNLMLEHIAKQYPRTSLQELLKTRILDPIGADAWSWQSVPESVGSNMAMTARDFAKYGLLWLSGGAQNGQQILSRKYVAMALEPANPELKSNYGWLWWVNAANAGNSFQRYGYSIEPLFSPEIPSDAFLTAGCSGSYLLVIPSQNLLAVRGGEGCVSIRAKTDPRFFRHARKFTELVMAVNGPNNSEKPQPPKIINVVFDDATLRVEAPGSDNWPLAWASNDNLYTTWGDGGGFAGDNNKGRVSLGVGVVSGDRENYVGRNIAGGVDSDAEAPFAGKSLGMLALGNTLYMWRNGDGSNTQAFKFSQLYRSDDLGVSWHATDVKFDQGGEFSDSDPGFFAPTFCQFGKGYSGNDDGYVYVFAPEANTINHWNVQQPGHVALTRVATKKIAQQDAYEFFAGLNENGEPRWTRQLSERRPVLNDDIGGSHRLSVTYNSGIERYVLTKMDKNRKGRFSLYEAEQPWGPWQLVHLEENIERWGNKTVAFHFVNKWTSSDGIHFTMVYTRDDHWASIEGHFELN